MRRHWIVKVASFLVLAAAVLAMVTFVVMSLWNVLVPSLFAGPHLSFWQAAGLLVLCRILVGGFRGHGWRHGSWRARWERMSPEERTRFREGFAQWRQMSAQERREFRGRFGGCGGGPQQPEES